MTTLRHYVLANPRLHHHNPVVTACGLTRIQLPDEELKRIDMGFDAGERADTTCPACRAYLIDFRLTPRENRR